MNFLENSFAESTAYFFVNILKFIGIPFIKIKIFEIRFLALKKFCSRRSISIFSNVAEDSLDFQSHSM